MVAARQRRRASAVLALAALLAALLAAAPPAARAAGGDYLSLRNLPARPAAQRVTAAGGLEGDAPAPSARQRYHFPLLAAGGLEAVNAYLDADGSAGGGGGGRSAGGGGGGGFAGDVSPLLGPACGATNPARSPDGMCADYLSAFSGLAVLPGDAFAAALGGGRRQQAQEEEEDAAGTAAAVGGSFAAAGVGGGDESDGADSGGGGDEVLLLGITDRGPTVRCGALPGGARRVPRRLRESVAFAAPKFSPALVLARLNRATGRAELAASCFLRAPVVSPSRALSSSSSGGGPGAGSLVPVTGLPNLPGRSEEPAAWDQAGAGEDGAASTCRALEGSGGGGGAPSSPSSPAFPPASPFYFPPGYNVRGMDTADVKPLGWGISGGGKTEGGNGSGGDDGGGDGRNRRLCLAAEQDGPSLALVDCDFADPRRCGTVLRRWVPRQVPGNLQYPQTDRALPVQPLLPALFGLRRGGRGLRALAVSPSGRRAVALLGGSVGSAPRGFGDAGASHLVYAADLDLSDPMAPVLAGVYAYAAEWADVDGAVPRGWPAVPGARPQDVTVGAAEWAGQFCAAGGGGRDGGNNSQGQERPVLLVSEYVAIAAEAGGRPGSGAAAYGAAAASSALLPEGAAAARSVLPAGAGQSKIFLADFGAATNIAASSALLAAVEAGDVDSLFSRTLVAERDYARALEAVRARFGLAVAPKSAAPLVDSADAAGGAGGDAPGARRGAAAFDARQEGLAAVNDCWIARGQESGYGMGGAPPGAVSVVQLGTCLSAACAAL